MRSRSRIILLLIPALLLYLALFIYPAIRAFWVSLHDWSGFTAKMKYIGLANFAELLHDDLFWQTLLTTLKFIFIGGSLIFVLAFLFTFFLTSGIRGRKVYRAVIFYPNVVAPIALATFWGFLYSPRFGMINGFLRVLGLESWTQTWTGPTLVFWSVLAALVWTYVGFYMVILMSGVDKIPPDYFDAARIAGASRPQIFFYVIIPLIWDVLVIAIVLWIIISIKMFEFLYAFSGGLAVPMQIWTNALYMFILTFGQRVGIYRMGYGTTVAVMMLLMVIVFSGIARLLMRREKIEF